MPINTSFDTITSEKDSDVFLTRKKIMPLFKGQDLYYGICSKFTWDEQIVICEPDEEHTLTFEVAKSSILYINEMIGTPDHYFPRLKIIVQKGGCCIINANIYTDNLVVAGEVLVNPKAQLKVSFAHMLYARWVYQPSSSEILLSLQSLPDSFDTLYDEKSKISGNNSLLYEFPEELG